MVYVAREAEDGVEGCPDVFDINKLVAKARYDGEQSA